MMRQKKKALILKFVLLVVLLLGLAGCLPGGGLEGCGLAGCNLGGGINGIPSWMWTLLFIILFFWIMKARKK